MGRPPLPGGPYLVVGLARSGQAVARLLASRGERVLGCDSNRPPGAAGLAEAGVEVSLEVDGTALLEQVKTVVKSPGVPRDAAVIAAARERAIEVIRRQVEEDGPLGGELGAVLELEARGLADDRRLRVHLAHQ